PRIFSTTGYELTTDLNSSSRVVNMNLTTSSLDAPTVKSSIAVPAETWNQVVGVWTGDAMRLYINGALSGSISTTLVPSYSRGFIPTIGINSGAYNDDHYAGLIDDLRIYNVALSGSDIQQLYLTEVPEPSTVLIVLMGSGVL